MKIILNTILKCHGWYVLLNSGLNDIVCSFDKDDCIVQVSGSGWVRFHGATPTALSGPDGDHTTGRGGIYAIYFQAN